MLDLNVVLSCGRWFPIESIARWYMKENGDQFWLIGKLWDLIGRDDIISSINRDEAMASIPGVVWKMRSKIKVPSAFSVRLDYLTLLSVRQEYGLTLEPVDESCPRIFDDKGEDDTFAHVPLHEDSIVTVNLTRNPASTEHDIRLASKLSHAWPVFSYHESLCRIHTLDEAEFIENLKRINPNIQYLTNVSRRRELIELPDQFLKELIAFNMNFLYGSLGKNKSIKLNEEEIGADEVSARLREWILHCLRIYDHTSGVPFGAYLVKMSKIWIRKSLNRIVLPREINEIKQRIKRAKEELKILGDYNPSSTDIAEEMGVTVKEYHAMSRRLAEFYHVTDPNVSFDQPERTTANPLGTIIPDIPPTKREPLSTHLTRSIIFNAPNLQELKNVINVMNRESTTLPRWAKKALA